MSGVRDRGMRKRRETEEGGREGRDELGDEDAGPDRRKGKGRGRRENSTSEGSRYKGKFQPSVMPKWKKMGKNERNSTMRDARCGIKGKKASPNPLREIQERGFL